MTQHSNPDEKLDEILADFGEAMHGDHEHVQAKYKAKQAMLSNFISKDKVREALKDEKLRHNANPHSVKTWNIKVKNALRAEARSKLGIEDTLSAPQVKEEE